MKKRILFVLIGLMIMAGFVYAEIAIYKVYQYNETFWKEEATDDRLVAGETFLIVVKGITKVDYTVPAGQITSLKIDAYAKETVAP